MSDIEKIIQERAKMVMMREQLRALAADKLLLEHFRAGIVKPTGIFNQHHQETTEVEVLSLSAALQRMEDDLNANALEIAKIVEGQ